jgi:hypothetical protein
VIADAAIALVIVAGVLGAVWSIWAVVSGYVPGDRRLCVYIAAPFAPCDGLDSRENTRRAVVLAMHYRRRGYRVVCVHPDIRAGRYGDDHDPAQRAAGAARTLALCQEVARSGGRLAVLQKPAGGLSSGTAREAAAFVDITPPARMDVWRWDATTNRPRRVRR